MSDNTGIRASLALQSRLGGTAAVAEESSVADTLKSRVAAEKLARLALETNSIVADFMGDDGFLSDEESGEAVAVTISITTNGKVYLNQQL